jgi:hypothetical protein
MVGSRLLLLIGVVLVAAACSFPEPYVFRPKEFDRTQPDFGREPSDLTEVVICYNTRSATPEAVRQLAAESCGRYGRTAQFRGHQFLGCPLLTPGAAEFTCVR